MPLIFLQPVQFAEARQAREVRSVLPTGLTSAELERISPELLERATFSARVSNAQYLDEIDRVLDDMLSGKIDQATARLALKQKLDQLGYAPTPEDVGTIKDFSSDARTNLVLETSASQAYGYGQWAQGQDEAILDQWPAQELYRAAAANVPRNWPAIWQNHGGELFGGRMIALKDDPIWSDISRFGTPYPPFDFGSHMDIRDIDRETAMSLGLIDRDTQIAPQTRDFNRDLQWTPEVRSDALRQALEEHGFEEGVLTP